MDVPRERILVIDIGGNHVKLMISRDERRKLDSGPDYTPGRFIDEARRRLDDWEFDAIALGYPGRVLREQIAEEPENLGTGWTGFDFSIAFERPVRIMNDAALQALGGYRGGRMLFLGLGTAVGSALIADGVILPMELASLRFTRRKRIVDVLSRAALERSGVSQWEEDLHQAVELLRDSIRPDEVVLGGGNADAIESLPPGCRRGDNRDAFEGGVRLWQQVARPDETPPSKMRVA